MVSHCSSEIKSLLESEAVRNKVSSFIREETTFPNLSDSGSDIEIIEENINRHVINKNRKHSMKEKFIKTQKKTLIQVHNHDDSYANVCGIQVHVKSLLQNEDIRKQIAPFIEAEVIPEGSDFTDVEVDEQNINLNLQSVNDINKLKALEKSNLINNEQKSCSKKIQIFDLVDSSDDEILVTEKIITTGKHAVLHKIQSKNKIVEESIYEQITKIETNSEYYQANYENIIIDENLFISNILEETQSSDFNKSKINDTHESKFQDSDDLYYLNFVTSPKESNFENDVITEKNVEPNLNKTIEITKEVVSKRPKRRCKAKGWSNSKKKKNPKVKLKSRIVKRNVKDVEINSQNINIQSYSNNDQLINAEPISTHADTCFIKNNIESSTDVNKNTFYKAEQTSIIKEEAILPIFQEIADFTINTKIETASNIEGDLEKLNSFENEEKFNLQGNPVRNAKRSCKQISKLDTKNGRKSAKSCIIQRRKVYAKCTKCNKKYERYGNMLRHKLLCHEIKIKILYECVMCPYQTKIKLAFKNHLGTHIFGKNYYNYDTNHIENQLNFIKEKKKIVCPPSYLKARCQMCKENTTAVQWMANCRRCYATLNYWCYLCGKNYAKYTDLRKHVTLNLKFASSRICSKCGKGDHVSCCQLKKHEIYCGTKLSVLGGKQPFVRLIRHDLQTNNGRVNLLKAYCLKCKTIEITFEKTTKCEKCESLLLYKCELCNELSATYSDLRFHVLNTHIIESYQCNKCGKVYEQLCTLKEHEKFCGSKIPLQSNEYDLKESNKDDLIHSKKQQSNEGTVFKSKFNHGKTKIKKCGLIKWMKRYCHRCNEIKRDSDKIKIGKNIELCGKCKTELLYLCIKCNRKFQTYHILMHHLKYKCVPIPRFQCSKCFSSSVFKKSYFRIYKNKKKQIILNNEQCINCSYCKKMFNTFENFKVHEENCKIRKIYQCTKCFYECHYKNLWDIHQHMHAWRESRKKKYIFNNLKDNLRRLRKVSCDPIKVECLNCKVLTVPSYYKSKCCKCKNSLSYQCSICNKIFERSYSQARNHVMIKHEFWTYQCSKCKNRLMSAHELQKHQAVCNKIVNYVCSKCSFKTNIRQLFIKHLLKNHLYNSYRNSKQNKHCCEKCDFEAYLKISFVNFVREEILLNVKV